MKRAREEEKPREYHLILVEADVSTLTLKFRRVEHTKTHEEKPIREEHTKNHDGDNPESPRQPAKLRCSKKVLARILYYLIPRNAGI